MENESNQPPSEAPKEETLDEGLKLVQELNEYRDKYFRALAESENMRKRLQKEKLEAQNFAIQSVVVDFLQPLDHFEQALRHAENAAGDVKNWALGFEMILGHFKQILQDNGVVGFDSVGTAFDPHVHEAIETVETTDFAEGTVIEECMRGYKMGNRVVRPAKVKVATAPKNDQ